MVWGLYGPLGAFELCHRSRFVPRRVVFSARMGEADQSSDAPLAQLVERQSHNLKVASSILAGSNPLLLSLPRSRSPHPTPCSIVLELTRLHATYSLRIGRIMFSLECSPAALCCSLAIQILYSPVSLVFRETVANGQDRVS